MSLSSENPAHFSKSRLKSDLVAHNVALPPAKSRKEVYVELHLKHIQRKNAAEFSSDEEDRVENAEEEDERMPDLSGLTDDDLKAALLRHGVEAGPIVASTRGVYENKLRKLLQSDGQGVLNGAERGVLYSDSEDEEETVEQDVEESSSKKGDRPQQGSSEMESSRSHSVDLATERDVNGCNVQQQQQQQHWSRFNRLDIQTPKGGNLKNQSMYYTPKESTYESEIKEPVKDTFSLPNTTATPTGIYATCRRPIKGAAGRPVQNTYPVTPASPTTQARQEVERRLVPVQIQILFFLVVVCLMYLVYVCVEDDSFSPFATLLDSAGSDGGQLSELE
ncbi:LEM domain-containing protein 1 isoform X8 [Pungitius pungitius]|uniref:LEM domain-containing protein 1 isoform X8 n=1 Tax=Pungitius pungitius TaxID=134920 RepID=UPI002E15FDCE